MEHILPEEFQLHETKSSASIHIKRARNKNLACELSQADNAAQSEEKNKVGTKNLYYMQLRMYFQSRLLC
jgi:hypothetical protein